MCDCVKPPVATTEFSERLLGMVNGGMLTLMISVGHRTGLFDTMAEIEPATSTVIAKAAKLNERYVREWLGAMVTGEIVVYDDALQTYHLPAEHAAVLTRKAAPNNMATFAQWVAVLGSVEDKIVECFHKGGGVPYSAYNRFHEVMAEESGQTTVAALTDTILPAVSGLVEKLTRGVEVLDIGCGAGRALVEMARSFPNSQFHGYDLCPETVAAAQKAAIEKGLTNIHFKQADVSTLLDKDRFDLITAFDAIHDQARPDVVLANINRALKPDGIFLMQDIKSSSQLQHNMDNPLAPTIYTISCMHCMSVSLAQGGMGLGAAWGHELARQMLADAGFKSIEMTELDHDILNYYYVARK